MLLLLWWWWWWGFQSLTWSRRVHVGQVGFRAAELVDELPNRGLAVLMNMCVG